MKPVAVCVPARDEAASLPRLLAAIDGQTGLRHLAPTICLFLDGCADDSVAVLERAMPRCRIVVEHAARARVPNAGRARARAMAIGLRVVGDRDGILLTTDADTAPAPDWIARMCRTLADVDVVAGRILRDQRDPCPRLTRIEAHLDRLFAFRRAIDPVAWEAAVTHHQSGGANLGFRASAYRAIGGFAEVASDEDVAIVEAAHRAGLRVSRDAGSLVVTSDRRDGRASGGLAETLARLDGAGEAAEVNHPEDEVWRYRHHARARAVFAAGELDDFARAIGVAAETVRAVARRAPNAEAFAMGVVPAPPNGTRRLPIDEAERVLDRLTAGSRALAAA